VVSDGAVVDAVGPFAPGGQVPEDGNLLGIAEQRVSTVEPGRQSAGCTPSPGPPSRGSVPARLLLGRIRRQPASAPRRPTLLRAMGRAALALTLDSPADAGARGASLRVVSRAPGRRQHAPAGHGAGAASRLLGTALQDPGCRSRGGDPLHDCARRHRRRRRARLLGDEVVGLRLGRPATTRLHDHGLLVGPARESGQAAAAQPGHRGPPAARRSSRTAWWWWQDYGSAAAGSMDVFRPGLQLGAAMAAPVHEKRGAPVGQHRWSASYRSDRGLQRHHRARECCWAFAPPRLDGPQRRQRWSRRCVYLRPTTTSLTGLPKPRPVHRATWRRALARAQSAAGTRVTVLFLDLDRFQDGQRQPGPHRRRPTCSAPSPIVLRQCPARHRTWPPRLGGDEFARARRGRPRTEGNANAPRPSAIIDAPGASRSTSAAPRGSR